MPDLADLTGVGPATEGKLASEGIETVEELAEADPSSMEEVSQAKATKLVRRASQQLIQSQTAAEMLEEFEDQEYRSTGIDELDEVLGGGWEPETIGMIYGQSGTAKTQVLFSTMGAVASEGPVVYLMTETQSKSIADRIRSLASEVDSLENIHIYEAYDVDDQYESYLKIGEEHDEIALLVVDSFTAQFRMNERFDGRENLGDRSAEMGRHLREIGEMARVYRCPVVMTGQVYESPDAWGDSDRIYGGQKMEHFVSYFVQMSNAEGTLREASLENHPGIEESSVKLSVGEESIEGVSE